jgi:transcriptional regulator with XRE-family HTH domain
MEAVGTESARTSTDGCLSGVAGETGQVYGFGVVVVVTDAARQRDAERRPDPPEDADGAADLYRAVGEQIKLLRERAGWTQKELGDRLSYGEDLISSLERGRRTPQPEFLDAVDELLGAGGLLKATKEDVARSKAKARVRHPAWFRDYARLEAEAVEVNFYSTLTVPGLLQTEEYARLTFAVRQPLLAEDVIEQRVTARLALGIQRNWVI